jgi:hypothetical protein
LISLKDQNRVHYVATSSPMESSTFGLFSPVGRRALARGFWRGLVAPASLYEAHDIPGAEQSIKFVPLPRRSGPPLSDWERVGADLREAARNVRDQRLNPRLEEPGRA